VLDVEQFLDPNIVPNRRYRLFHQYVSDFLCSKEKAKEFWTDPIVAHGAIARAYKGTSPHWSQVNWELTDQYGLLHIAEHLVKAGREDDLRSLLLEYTYLRAKLEAAGIAGLLSDLDMLPRDLAVDRVASAMRASAHALARDSEQLTAQLIGRIASGGAPELDSLLAAAHAAAPGCLLPLWPSLATPEAVALWASRVHSGVVTCLAVLSSGGIVSGGQDGRLLLWSAVAGAAPPQLIGEHTKGVRCLAVLPDDRIISGGDDGRILLWDSAESGVPLQLGLHEHIVLAITVLPDRRIVSGGADCRVILWEQLVEASRSRELGRQDGAVNCLATLADGRVVSGGAGVQVRPGIWMGQLWLWDPNGGASPLRLGQITREVTCVATLPRGGVVSGDLGGELRVWMLPGDASDQAVGFKLLGHQGGKVRCVGVLRDGCIVSGGEGLRAERPGSLLVWNSKSEGATPQRLGTHERGVYCLAPLPNGRVVSGGDDGTLRRWTHPARPQ
jgi:WD40 repeat protein